MKISISGLPVNEDLAATVVTERRIDGTVAMPGVAEATDEEEEEDDEKDDDDDHHE